MEALKRLTLALTVALVGAACGGDDSGGGKENLDGGGIKFDGGGTSADAGLPCAANTPPTADKCGGSECVFSLTELKGQKTDAGACQNDLEISSFCQLTPVTAATTCTVQLVVGGADTTDQEGFKTKIASCTSAKLDPAFSASCLDCFVESANCATQFCTQECLNPSAPTCDPCRIKNGCISTFYTCAGIQNPLDLLAATQR